MSENDEYDASNEPDSSIAYKKFVSNDADFEGMIAYCIYTSLENVFWSNKEHSRNSPSRKYEEILTDNFVSFVRNTAREKVNVYASSIILDTERNMNKTIVKKLPGRWRSFCQGVSASVVGTLLIGFFFTAAMHMQWLNPFVPIIETAKDIVDQRDDSSRNLAERADENPFAVEPAAGPPDLDELEACQMALADQMVCFDKRDLGLLPLGNPKTR